MHNKKKFELIDNILNRGIIKEIIPSKIEFQNRLLSNKPLKIYIGVDPTSNTLHLSHAKNYMLLEEFRTLGHKIFVLFGDFTAKIGDPTDRNSARKMLSEEEIKKNINGWMEQIKPLLKFEDPINPPQIIYNSKWLSALKFDDVVNLASNITVQRMLERSMFKKRIIEKKPIFLHEFMYPLMQGYDSVALDVDVELCGTDQIFNALVGRDLLKKKKKEKFVVAVNLMENPKTGELMSKSKGTGVFLDNHPRDIYGSIMSLPDEMTKILLINNTRIPLKEIEEILSYGPRDAKMIAAKSITAILHGTDNANEAENYFTSTFQKGKAPKDMPIVVFEEKELPVYRVVRECLSQDISNSQIRRFFEQNAIRINNKTMTTGDMLMNIKKKDSILNIGKRKWFKIHYNNVGASS